MRKVRKVIRSLLVLLLLGAAAGVGYMYLLPLMKTQEVQAYDAYTVHRGSIATENSFSAAISIASSETLRNTTRATAIREIYVEHGQEVRKGDKLMLLDNGELLKASLDGVVTEMRFDTKDWLWNNVDLIQISDLRHLKVSLSVDEYDVRNVSVGQKCHVTIVPTGEVYETEISHVDRVSSSSGQVAVYTVTADLTAPDSVLPGMTASVTIPSDRAENALCLDMAALAFDEEKQPYVLKKTDAGYQRVQVTTGLSDGMRVQILSGLQEGETVWAASVVEAERRTYTLSDLYRTLVGEKVVINDMTGSDRSGGGGASRMQMPGSSRENPGMASPTKTPGEASRTEVPGEARSTAALRSDRPGSITETDAAVPTAAPVPERQAEGSSNENVTEEE